MKKNNYVYWMSIVNAVAEASTCRVKIGAILVRDSYLLGVGYVGSVSGDTHCNENSCLMLPNHGVKGSGSSDYSCERTIHAETNAILKCKERGSDKDGWLTCYSTYSPCLNCTKLLLQIGVSTFVYTKHYKDLYRDKYLLSLPIAYRPLLWVSL